MAIRIFHVVKTGDDFETLIKQYLEYSYSLEESIKRAIIDILEKDYQESNYDELFNQILTSCYLRSHLRELIGFQLDITKAMIPNGSLNDIHKCLMWGYNLDLLEWTIDYKLKIHGGSHFYIIFPELDPLMDIFNSCNEGVYDMQNYREAKNKIKLVLKHGYDINTRINRYGSEITPLYFLVQRIIWSASMYTKYETQSAQIKMFDFLIKKGANINHSVTNSTAFTREGTCIDLIERNNLSWDHKYHKFTFFLVHIYKKYCLPEFYRCIETSYGIEFPQIIRDKILDKLKLF